LRQGFDRFVGRTGLAALILWVGELKQTKPCGLRPSGFSIFPLWQTSLHRCKTEKPRLAPRL